MGVLLTQSEVQIVNAQFGQPEDDRVNYEVIHIHTNILNRHAILSVFMQAFCKGLDSFMGTAAPKPAEQKVQIACGIFSELMGHNCILCVSFRRQAASLPSRL